MHVLELSKVHRFFCNDILREYETNAELLFTNSYSFLDEFSTDDI